MVRGLRAKKVRQSILPCLTFFLTLRTRRALPARFQILQQVVSQVVDVVLCERERVAAHWLFANRAIDKVFRPLLDPVEHDGSRAKMNVFVAYKRRPVAPRIPAAKRPTNQARI